MEQTEIKNDSQSSDSSCKPDLKRVSTMEKDYYSLYMINKETDNSVIPPVSKNNQSQQMPKLIKTTTVDNVMNAYGIHQ